MDELQTGGRRGSVSKGLLKQILREVNDLRLQTGISIKASPAQPCQNCPRIHSHCSSGKTALSGVCPLLARDLLREGGEQVCGLKAAGNYLV
jgi:hypothetical protein